MDEFGSCIRHSDDPTFGMSFMSYVPLGIFFSIIWPLKDLEYGGLFQANNIYKRRTWHVINVMLISKNNRFCSLSSFRFITCEVWCLTWCAFLNTPDEFSGLKVCSFYSFFLRSLGVLCKVGQHSSWSCDQWNKNDNNNNNNLVWLPWVSVIG